jgi:hypothetical protein
MNLNMTPEQFVKSMKGSVLAFTVFVILFGFDSTALVNNVVGRVSMFAGWEFGWALFTLLVFFVKGPVVDFFREDSYQ